MQTGITSEHTSNATRGIDDRGQTLQDYVTGVSLLLIVVIFVFGLFPNYLTPFTAGVSGAEQAQADRIGRNMISNLSVEAGRNTLNASRLRSVLALSQPELRDRYGLPNAAEINITVRDPETDRIVTDGGQKLATDRQYRDTTAASIGRVVTLDNGTCSPACRLVIYVW